MFACDDSLASPRHEGKPKDKVLWYCRSKFFWSGTLTGLTWSTAQYCWAVLLVQSEFLMGGHDRVSWSYNTRCDPSVANIVNCGSPMSFCSVVPHQKGKAPRSRVKFTTALNVGSCFTTNTNCVLRFFQCAQPCEAVSRALSTRRHAALTRETFGRTQSRREWSPDAHLCFINGATVQVLCAPSPAGLLVIS